ncbi:MAG: MliC family protein [Leptotrichiaceae bacterium]|nr:MliC family protein [Leptotrichiaceae bacterium]
MKKGIMVAVFAAILAVSCSSGGNRKAVTMEKDTSIAVTSSDNMMSENKMNETMMMENNTDKMEMTENKMQETMKKTYTCGKMTVTVESTTDGEEISLTDGMGTHQLKRTVSASGELYKDSKGKSMHMKGDEAVYKASAKAKDVVCKVVE